MRKITLLILIVISFVLFSPVVAYSEETLEVYWPIHASERDWNLINSQQKDLPHPQTMMKVSTKITGTNQVDVWFSNKPGQAAGMSDVEQYEYCGNAGGHPWLFMNGYVEAKQDHLERFHPVKATRILFTPDNKQTFDLISDGTYSRCGNKGQPYLFWTQNLEVYRIQVWGYLSENPKLKWYWDATVSKPAPVTNDCLKPAQTVKALKVQEAWWSNFKVAEGKWVLGNGDMGNDGLPTGINVTYGRTVWHAQGQTPYYLIGQPDGKTVYWCVQ